MNIVTTETIFNNMQNSTKVFVNKEFLSIFYPFYYIHTILCMRQYKISNNYVEKNSRKSIVGVVIIIFVMIWYYYQVMETTDFSVTTYRYIYNVIYSVYLLNFMVVCFINVYYSSTNVRLLSILQEINNLLYNCNDSRKFKKLSFLSTLTLLCFGVVLVSFKITYDPSWNLWRGLYVCTSILLDLEIVQTMLYTYILTYKFHRWNHKVKSTDFEINNYNEEITQDRETVLEEIQNAILLIFEAWDLTLQVAGLNILIHFVTTFIQTLVYVGVLITWSKTHFENIEVIISHTFGVLLWLSKVFIVKLGLCLACEAFYEELGKAQSNLVIKVSQDLPSKKLWKNLFRVLHKDFEKMNGCGLFTVDAVTLLNFCKLVATYTIVLLQFAFL